MDEIKKVKSLQKIKKYLKSEKFSHKKNIFIKYHEEKEGKEICKNIEKICSRGFFFQSRLLKIYLCMVFMKIKNFMSLFLYKSLKLKIILI